MLDLDQPLLEQFGDRLDGRSDDAAVDLGDEQGELLLGGPLATAKVLPAVPLRAGERVGAFEHPQLPVARAALPHRASHQRRLLPARISISSR
ncbi:MAG: hypothetical protein M3Q48_06550 [Actinomycetota bacterium]|nr:hypothetical protein [Actinomycetota bacterium]